MEVVCEWFVANGSSVRDQFPGWKPPRPEPLHRQLTNPFTGEAMFDAAGKPIMEDSYFPEEPWTDPVECPALAQFGPSNLWPIGILELPQLAEALGMPECPAARDFLFAPKTYGWFLNSAPASLVSALCRVEDYAATSKVWARCLQEKHGAEAWEDLYALVEDWHGTLRTLVDLARVAESTGDLLLVYQGCCVPT